MGTAYVKIVSCRYGLSACENVIYIRLMERQGRGVALVLYFALLRS
jgi:hypothetical protein